jgi:erythromycin esterase-like protein
MRRLLPRLIIAIAVLALAVAGCAKPMTPQDFVAENYAPINLEDSEDLTAFSLLDPYLDENTVFLTGEAHATQMNGPLKLRFLRYFREAAGVKYYLGEMSYASSCLVNRYLEIGDETILTRMMGHYRGTAPYTVDEIQWWKDLRAYNLTLPEDEQIKIVGIDIEHRLGLAVWYLSILLPETSPPGAIAPIIDEIVDLNHRDSKTVTPPVREIATSIEANMQDYKDYLGDRFSEF